MAKAIVTVAFWGARDNRPGRRVRFMPGDTLDGDIGDVAIREGYARPAEKKRPANKMMDTPENKQELGVSSQAVPRSAMKTSRPSRKRKSKR
jgi:hypothetical protein